MVYYELFAEYRYDSACGYYHTYGIAAYRSGKVVRIVGDVSVDHAKVDALVKLYNDERLSPDQLDEAIEDFLYDFEVCSECDRTRMFPR